MAQKLPLTEFHKNQLGAKMGEFAGFEVPLEFSGCIIEHVQTRNNVSLCDASHMRVYKIDRKFFQKLNFLIPRRISSDSFGAMYVIFLNCQGGIEEDSIMYLLDDIYIVGNALNCLTFPRYLREHSIEFEMIEPVIFALQGPRSKAFASGFFPKLPLSKDDVIAKPQSGILFISQTGYTGELGYEIFFSDVDLARKFALWCLDASIQFCGLIARDTLRLETGFTLYGNELSPDFSPLESDLKWILDDQKDFLAKDRLREESFLSRFYLKEFSGVPRKGFVVTDDTGRVVGSVTSGAKTPCIDHPIGFVRIHNVEKCSSYFVKIRDRSVSLQLVNQNELRAKIKREGDATSE
ncbi:MAG: hypothetical protein NZO16_07850 [Deltaproteobacteria bacterium]|nr:hypothetical protein [Deltaproteobacteria bacterium]